LAFAIYLRPSSFEKTGAASTTKQTEEKALWKNELEKSYPFVVGEVPQEAWDYSDLHFAETVRFRPSLWNSKVILANIAIYSPLLILSKLTFSPLPSADAIIVHSFEIVLANLPTRRSALDAITPTPSNLRL
jgi:hypothetical protein